MQDGIIKDYNSIIESLKSGTKLSAIIPSVLILAKTINDQELIKWAELELGGYFDHNKALTQDTFVPDFRIVVGEYHDTFDRPLMFEDPKYNFVNQVRLRNTIAELEKLAEKTKLLVIRDSSYLNLIKKNFKVEVESFWFSPTSVLGVLDGIRSNLITRLLNISSIVEQSGKLNHEKEHTSIHMSLENLHPLIKSVAEKLFTEGNYRHAILDSYILLINTVKTKSGRHDLDGVQLMQTVFSPKNPIVKTSNDLDEQQGFMYMFIGAVMGIRNPKAHTLIEQKDPQRTLEWLSFASVLLRVLDDSEVIKNDRNS
jgi:uncharacterized protein (TIGR02391 family)